MISERKACPVSNRNRAAQAGGLIRYFLILVGALVVVVTFTPVVPWWGKALAGSFDDPSGDVLVVLAAAHNDEEMLSYSSYLRTEYALRAYKTGGFKRVIVSGGGVPNPTAAAMRDLLQYEGIPNGVIEVETSSKSTRENAIETRKLLGNPDVTVVLLTSDYHMYRAAGAFRKAGLHVVPRPFPDVCKRGSQWAGRWPAFLDLCRESVKIGYYRMRGWI